MGTSVAIARDGCGREIKNYKGHKPSSRTVTCNSTPMAIWEVDTKL